MGITAIVGSIIGAVKSAGAAIAAAGTAVAGGIAAGAEAIGIPAAIAGGIGTGLEGAGIGAGVGALEGLVTHGNIGEDALLGGISGGAIGGFGPALGGLTGLGTTAGDTLVGAGTGAAEAALTHRNPLTGALEGGAAGFAAGTLSSMGQPGAPPTSAGAGGGGTISAAGTAAPASVPLSSPDISMGGTFADSGAGVGGVDAGAALSGGGAASATGAGVDAVAANAGAPSALTANLPGTAGVGAAQPGGAVAATPGSVDVLSAGGTIASPGGGTDITVGAPTINGGIDAGSSINGGIAGGGASATTGMAPAGGASSFLGTAAKYAPLALTAGSLGLDVLKGNQPPKFESQLLAEANQAAAQGKLLQNYEASGTLPPGMQAGINAAQDSAAAAIRSQYASRGQSGSSAEAQDLQSLGIRTQAQGESEAAALFTQGFQDTQLSNSIYTQLMQVQLQQDQNLSTGVTNLVSAMASMGRPVAVGA